MPKTWRHTLFVLLLTLLLGSSPAQAQNPVTIERLQIDLWPEYDQPSMLVIYHITLAGETSIPANLNLRIPARAGEPYNVAFQNVDGMLLNLEYTTQKDGEWLTVSFVALSPVLQIEYYDPGLQIEGTRRSFEYTWPGDLPVRSLSVNLQHPRNATQVTSTMSGASTQIGADGLTYSLASYGLVETGQPLNVNLSYEKADNSLSVSAAPVAAMQSGANAAAAAPAGDQAGSISLPVLILVAVLLVIAGTTFYYILQTRRLMPAPATRRRHAPNRAQINEVGFDEPGESVYCPQCGRRSIPGDLFCRACGNHLQD